MKVYCPFCKKEQEIYLNKKVIKKYKGVTVNIEGDVPICKGCGEILFVEEIEKNNMKKIYDKYREEKNIISAEDIINFRKKYNISQRELTGILDFGKMTINRYENGAVPTKAQSDYLKLIFKSENEFMDKAYEAYEEGRITEKTYKKVKDFNEIKK